MEKAIISFNELKWEFEAFIFKSIHVMSSRIIETMLLSVFLLRLDGVYFNAVIDWVILDLPLSDTGSQTYRNTRFVFVFFSINCNENSKKLFFGSIRVINNEIIKKILQVNSYLFIYSFPLSLD